MHQLMAETLDGVVDDIHATQHEARTWYDTDSHPPVRPRWPVIILKTPKGWTGPKEVDGQKTEGSWRSHQVPIAEMSSKPEHVKLLKAWMQSYRPDELFDKSGKLIAELAELAPKGTRRMGANPHANGGVLLTHLHPPHFRNYDAEVAKPGVVVAAATPGLGAFLRDGMKQNMVTQNF